MGGTLPRRSDRRRRLLPAAHQYPLDRRYGACGTRKALCESGTYHRGPYIKDALSADEAAADYALPCSMRLTSDLVLQIASTSDVAKTQATAYTSTLAALDPHVGQHRLIQHRHHQSR